MAKRRIKFSLSTDSINEAIRQIEEYKRSLDNKLDVFVERLAEVGVHTARVIMETVPQNDRGEYNVETIYDSAGEHAVGATISLYGDQVLFIEFSSGITNGTDSFPSLPNNPSYGSKYGMGTFPSDKGLWANPKGWWYTNRRTGQTKQHTYGVRAYAPMYNADITMRHQLATIAREVFGG